MIRLRVLGASEIRCGRKLVTPATEVVFALGFYLCARAGERLAREDVSEVFWGEGRESQGRHSLRQMLYRLRQKGLELDEDGEELYLDPARVDSDLATALGDGWPEGATAAEAEAAGLLAPGFTRPISERFQEWLDGIRDRLAAQHRRASLRQIALARREGRWADLDRWALQVLKSDPLNEEATLARAESAAISGSKAVALEIIDAYMEELGDRAPVIGLPASLLRRRIAERKADWSGRGRREVPLVGRQELMSRLTGYVDAAARGEGRSVVLWGAPGIGKTRLAEEACAYAEVEGFRSVVVRSTAFGGSRPLALLFSLVPALRQLPGALGCHPATLTILNNLSVDAERFRPTSELPFDTSFHEVLVAGLRDILEAVTLECRVLVFTDDVHNADKSSLEVLHAVLPEHHAGRLLWLATSRHQLVQEATGLKKRMMSLYVPPLDSAAARAMAQSLSHKATASEAERIATAAGGNPLFVAELSNHHPLQESGPERIPRSLTEMIASRLDSLESALIRLLRLVTLLGNQATVLRLKQLSVRDADLTDQLETLELQGILRLNSSKAVELHECWHHTISTSMSSSARAALSLECATLLSNEQPRSLESSWRSASLYADVGEYALAARLFYECGEEFLVRGLPADAARLAAGALDIALAPSDRIQLLSVKARSENALGMIDQVVVTCELGIASYQNDGAVDLQDYTILIALLADALAKTHRDNSGAIKELARLVQLPGVPAPAKQFACLQGIAGVYANAPSPLEDLFVEAARQSQMVHGESTMGLLVELIHAAEHGASQEILELERRCAQREDEQMPVGLRARALFTRAAAQRFVGEWETCTRIAGIGFALANEHRLLTDAVRIANLMIFMHLDQDEHDLASEWIDRRQMLAAEAPYSQANHELRHARARLHAQREEYSLGIREYGDQAADSEKDRMKLRRGVDLATLAVCHAGAGLAPESRVFLGQCSTIVQETRASLQNDFMVEMLLRTLSLLDEADEFQSLGASYATRRAVEYPGTLPKGHRTLAQFILRAPPAAR